MDDLDGLTKGLIIMGIITVSVLAWFLVASLAGEYLDHKPLTPDEPDADPQLEPQHQPITARPGALGSALNRTPAHPRLLAAVSSSNWAAAHQLMRSGVSLRGVDAQGHSLLDLALRKKDEKMVQLLESHGAKRSG